MVFFCEECNLKCRRYRGKRSTPWFAILCGLAKEHKRKEHGMEQGESSRKGKHWTRKERVVIERMSRGGRPKKRLRTGKRSVVDGI
jgi:hypothetical protein